MLKRKWYIGVCFILITLFFIWSNSLKSVVKSNEQSGRVLEIIEEIFHTPPLNTEGVQHIVRKAAHMIEFALLGLEIVLLLLLTRKMRRQSLVAMLFIGLASAVIDETIQVFSQRGSQVVDIWIDFAGFIIGAGIGMIAHTLWHRVRIRLIEQKQTAIESK